MSRIGIKIVGNAERTLETHWLWVAPSPMGTNTPIGMWLTRMDYDLEAGGWRLVVDAACLKVRTQHIGGVDHIQVYIHETLLDE